MLAYLGSGDKEVSANFKQSLAAQDRGAFELTYESQSSGDSIHDWCDQGCRCPSCMRC